MLKIDDFCKIMYNCKHKNNVMAAAPEEAKVVR